MVEVEYIGKRQEDDLLDIINYEADGRAESESRFESISVPLHRFLNMWQLFRRYSLDGITTPHSVISSPPFGFQTKLNRPLSISYLDRDLPYGPILLQRKVAHGCSSETGNPHVITQYELLNGKSMQVFVENLVYCSLPTWLASALSHGNLYVRLNSND